MEANGARNKLFQELSMGKQDKVNALQEIVNSKEYLAYKKNNTPENKDAYQNFLREFLKEKNIIPVFIVTGTTFPERGNKSLEEYIVEMLDMK
jgi:hypothetical protein